MKIIVNDKCVFSATLDVDDDVSVDFHMQLMELIDQIVDTYIEGNPSLIKECLEILKKFNKEKNIDGITKFQPTTEEFKEIDELLIQKTAEYIKVYNDDYLYMSHLGYTYYMFYLN